MNRQKQYYVVPQFNLQNLENIEEKKLIHQFENKDLEIHIDNLEEKYLLNQIR